MAGLLLRITLNCCNISRFCKLNEIRILLSGLQLPPSNKTMPLVFVHGVNVRDDSGYDEEVSARDAYFREFLLKEIFADPQKVQIFNPYWGKHGVKFAWNQASLPTKGIEELGPEDDLPALFLSQILVTEVNNPDTLLLEIAKHQSLEDIVDLLWAVGSEGANKAQGAELANLALRAVDYVRHNPHPTWLDLANEDEEFIDAFEKAVDEWKLSDTPVGEELTQEWETLGFPKAWRLVEEGADRVKRATRKLVRRAASQTASSVAKSTITSSILSYLRPNLHRRITRFIGDVFVYLTERGTAGNPGLIVQEILDELEQARAAINSEDDKLIVVAHSMGGNIMYDILTHFKPEFQLDWLITVGSQIALFEEIKCFRASDKTVPNNPRVDRMPKPKNVKKHWINILDYDDVLGFSASGVFENVEDFSYSTKDGVMSHGSYFSMPTFYQRLSQRIRQLSK